MTPWTSLLQFWIGENKSLVARTRATLTDLHSYSDSIDIKLLSRVGENLSEIIRGDKNLLEILMDDNMLAEFYAKSFGIDTYLNAVAQAARQISHRYPHVNVLEIGKFTRVLLGLILIDYRSRCWRYFGSSHA